MAARSQEATGADECSYDAAVVLQAIYDSEINAAIWWCWDGGIQVGLHGGCQGPETWEHTAKLESVEDAVTWLVKMIQVTRPESEFALRHDVGRGDACDSQPRRLEPFLAAKTAAETELKVSGCPPWVAEPLHAIIHATDRLSSFTPATTADQPRSSAGPDKSRKR